jgi:hypothetical protein
VTYFQHARRERPGIGLVGFPCPHELRADIAGLDLFGLARWSAPNLTVVSGATDEAERVLVDELRRRGLRTRLHPVATAVDWEELGSVGRSLTAAEATSATLAALAEG